MIQTGTRVIYEAVCRVSWCTKAATVRGLCKTHYNRWQMEDPVYTQALGKFRKKGAKSKPKPKRQPKTTKEEAMKKMVENEVGGYITKQRGDTHGAITLSERDDAGKTMPDEKTHFGLGLDEVLDQVHVGPMIEKQANISGDVEFICPIHSVEVLNAEWNKRINAASTKKELHDFLRHTILKVQCIVMLLDGHVVCRSAHVQALAQEISDSLEDKMKEIG
uniref:Uncharacterized protein n=1 Tax=viral metagenome TaxID=1070528 RepID=A0A6M3JR64_9ZZZZ